MTIEAAEQYDGDNEPQNDCADAAPSRDPQVVLPLLQSWHEHGSFARLETMLGKPDSDTISGFSITEFKLAVPGNYTLVDHAIARMERGLLGVLHVEGPKNPEIYNGEVMPGMGH